MAELMAAADLAIGSGGSATWERCCLGLPTVTLCVADNQRRLVEEAALCGLVYATQVGPEDAATLARHLQSLMENPLLLRAMSRNGLRMVDGRGRERVVRALGYSDVRVRDATPADSANILFWRNEPNVRLVSIDSRAIDRATHDAWFASVMADPDRMLLIGERGQREVGVVRFDIREDEARVSIFLAPGLAGTGIGSDLLAAGEEDLAERRRNVKVVLADVKGGNLASRKLFEAAGYELRSALYVKRLRTP
jgi:RimJ/RimL family protein N-acetyltransferase